MDSFNQNPQHSNELDWMFYMSVISKRFWTIASVIVLCVLLSLLVSFLTKPEYKAAVLMMIDREDAAKIDSQNTVSSWNADEDYYRTQYKLLESASLLNSVYNDLNLGQYEEFDDPDYITKFRKKIEISPVQRSRLVNIEAVSVDPHLAMKIANTLADNYVSGNISNRVFIAQDMIKALNSDKSKQSDRELLNSIPQVVNNDLIKKYKQEQTDLELQKARLSARYTPEHPDLISVQKQIDTIKHKIDDETAKIVQSVKMDLSGQLLGNNVRIIDRATLPLKPYKPNKKINLLIGLSLGCFCGFIAAFIIEFLDQTVKNSEDVESKLHLPFLGVSYAEKRHRNKSEYHSMTDKGNHLSAESVRNVRTMLDFALANSSNKTILVASSVQGEGKSYLSSNLAVSVAQSGSKTLLIDGDLRRSRLHKVFKVANDQGLSNILAMPDVKDVSGISKTVSKTDVDNLYVIPSGQKPPNPSELLNTPKLRVFIEWAEKNYDRVIIDCPAVLPITDTLLFGKNVHNAVFAVKTASTNAKLAKTAAEHLKKAGINVLGVVLTMYESKSFKYEKYYKEYKYSAEAPKKS